MRFSLNGWNGGAVCFRDRRDAGRQLAGKLEGYAAEQPLVIALPRGGVQVGYEVARALDAALDVWVVRKVGVPWHPELGVGAVAEGGYTYLQPGMLAALGLSERELDDVIERERSEVQRRVKIFRAGAPPPDVAGRTILLVDDGIATGGTVRVALRAIRAQRPKRLVLAVPVAAPETLDELASEVDETVCLLAPRSMHAIGLWYQDFRQVSNEEVVHLLELRREERARTLQGPAKGAA
jgi:putative phosphoribosyl transferase